MGKWEEHVVVVMSPLAGVGERSRDDPKRKYLIWMSFAEGGSTLSQNAGLNQKKKKKKHLLKWLTPRLTTRKSLKSLPRSRNFEIFQASKARQRQGQGPPFKIHG